MEIDFTDKKVFLTGGSRGIGKKIKETMELAGAKVTAPTREELNLEDEKSVEKYLGENAGVNPDIIICCAGINRLAGIGEIEHNLVQQVFQVNCFSTIEICKKYTSYMRKKHSGKIIFVSSLYAMVSRERRIAYSASKNALNGLMKSMALELAPDNILVNAVAPGYVMTDMTKQNLSLEEIKKIEEQIPTGRFQSEEDIANMVAFLCSDLNNSVTGQLIAVDGGFLCR